ncbi:hypothetical protein yc1106_00038 [Curvularia clavata]|uniref:Uncharacterized protein n=1 Tax=Curvularia clavata TaxID=95742 RepID=A0A9Q8YZD2_CURCL|nr:hypothetical protein yc1106_00038 [Curvularia clavata]
MDGKSKHHAPSKVFNTIDFNDDDQSTISMPAYTPRSSYDIEYTKLADTKSRFLQLGPEMIQLSSTLRDRLSPGDPMIAAWDDLINTLHKGCETPTPRASAAPTHISDTEKHAIQHAPNHELPHKVERNGDLVWRLCNYPSNINDPSDSGHDEGFKTGIKRSYCESVEPDANFPGSVTEEYPCGEADGLETGKIEGDLPTSDHNCICNEVGNWDGCKYCLDSKSTADKCTCDAWGTCNCCRNPGKCTCDGWIVCHYCMSARIDGDNDQWGCGHPEWSIASAVAPGYVNTPSRASRDFEALLPPTLGESHHSPPTHNTCHATSVPAADPPKYSNYTVTYWATIKYGEQTIQVPIDSDYVSGPEKRVIEGDQGMQMVWDWVVKKGLDKWIGLQDAFELTMDMQGDRPAGFFCDTEGDVNFNWAVKSESGSHRSRRGPLSAKRARLSPTPSDRYSLSVASEVLSR